MRTSLNEIKEIEGYLLETDSIENRLVLEAKLCIDADLAEKTAIQKEVYHQVKVYARRQLKAEISTVEHKLFTEAQHSGFRQKVLRFFNR